MGIEAAMTRRHDEFDSVLGYEPDIQPWLRIVRRAIRRLDDHSPTAAALRSAVQRMAAKRVSSIGCRDEDHSIRRVACRLATLAGRPPRVDCRLQAERETIGS